MQDEETKTVGRPLLRVEKMILDSFSIEPSMLELLRKAGSEVVEDGKAIGKAELVRRGIKMILDVHGYKLENTQDEGMHNGQLESGGHEGETCKG